MIRVTETLKTLSLMLAICAGLMVHHDAAAATLAMADATAPVLEPMVC